MFSRHMKWFQASNIHTGLTTTQYKSPDMLGEHCNLRCEGTQVGRSKVTSSTTTRYTCKKERQLITKFYTSKPFKLLNDKWCLKSLQWIHTPHCFIVEQSGPEMHVASHLVSLILVSALFAWCLVSDVGTLGNTLSGCATQDPRVAPQRLVLSIPLTFFVWFGCEHEWGLVLCM